MGLISQSKGDKRAGRKLSGSLVAWNFPLYYLHNIYSRTGGFGVICFVGFCDSSIRVNDNTHIVIAGCNSCWNDEAAAYCFNAVYIEGADGLLTEFNVATSDCAVS